jgi:hypothetical protein
MRRVIRWAGWASPLGRLIALGVVAVLLVGAFFTADHAATSLRVMVWKDVESFGPGPNPLLYDHTFTDLGFVHTIQAAVDGAGPSGNSCIHPTPEHPAFSYSLIFTILGGPPTERYDGSDYCVAWEKTVLGVPFGGVGIDGQTLVETLHTQGGVPISS